MNNNSLVSIIIPTRDRAYNLDRCLNKIKQQTYSNIEIIVVDGNSSDDTILVAEKYSVNFFVFNKKGDHRCAQRNLGVQKAKGEYVLIIDDDMELSEKVIEDCVRKINQEKSIKGIIIPEESFGEGFWTQCKKLERSFYLGLDWIEAARFFRREDYLKLGGYNEELTSGEDWDLSQRMEVLGKIDRINSFIYHNEGKFTLFRVIKKRYYYARKFVKYTDLNINNPKIKKQLNVIFRFKLFFSNPKKLFKNPIYGIAMLFMKACEFGFGGLGYLYEKYCNNFFKKIYNNTSLNNKINKILIFIGAVKKNKKIIYLFLAIIFIVIGFNGYLKPEQTRVFGDTRPNFTITKNRDYEYYRNNLHNQFIPGFREPYRNQLERIKFFLFKQGFSENFVLWSTTFLPFLISVYSSYFLFLKLSDKKFTGFLIWLFYTFSTFSLFTSSIHTNILTSINFFLFYIFLHTWYLENFKNFKKTIFYIFTSIFVIFISFVFEMRMMIVTFPFFFIQIIILFLEHKKDFSLKLFIRYLEVHLLIFFGVLLNFIYIFLNFSEILSQISSIIPLETWGNVYFQLINSLTFFHPFWNNGEAVNFIYNIPSPLYIINISFIIFTLWLVWHYRKSMRYKILYVLPLIFFLFLSKQNHAPLKNFYDFLYKFPYFSFSREASKYYYGYLLSFSFLSLAAFNINFKQKITKYIIYFLLLIFLIPTFNNFKIFALGDYGNTTSEYEYNITVYDEINNYLSKGEKDIETRVLWLPLKSTLQDDTFNIKHNSFIPMLQVYPFENIRKNSRSYLYESLNDEDFINYLKLMGFRYVIMPDINNEKGMLSELKVIYKDFNYESFIKYAETSMGIERIANIDNYIIYEFKDQSFDVSVFREAINSKYSQIGFINIFDENKNEIAGTAINNNDIKINFGNCNNNPDEGLDFDPIDRIDIGFRNDNLISMIMDAQLDEVPCSFFRFNYASGSEIFLDIDKYRGDRLELIMFGDDSLNDRSVKKIYQLNKGSHRYIPLKCASDNHCDLGFYLFGEKRTQKSNVKMDFNFIASANKSLKSKEKNVFISETPISSLRETKIDKIEDINNYDYILFRYLYKPGYRLNIDGRLLEPILNNHNLLLFDLRPFKGKLLNSKISIFYLPQIKIDKSFILTDIINYFSIAIFSFCIGFMLYYVYKLEKIERLKREKLLIKNKRKKKRGIKNKHKKKNRKRKSR